jgi:hypothetical protein
MEGMNNEQVIENLSAQVASLDAMNLESLKALHQARTNLIVKESAINQLLKKIEILMQNNTELEEKSKQLQDTVNFASAAAHAIG